MRRTWGGIEEVLMALPVRLLLLKRNLLCTPEIASHDFIVNSYLVRNEEEIFASVAWEDSLRQKELTSC